MSHFGSSDIARSGRMALVGAERTAETGLLGRVDATPPRSGVTDPSTSKEEVR